MFLISDKVNPLLSPSNPIEWLPDLIKRLTWNQTGDGVLYLLIASNRLINYQIVFDLPSLKNNMTLQILLFWNSPPPNKVLKFVFLNILYLIILYETFCIYIVYIIFTCHFAFSTCIANIISIFFLSYILQFYSRPFFCICINCYLCNRSYVTGSILCSFLLFFSRSSRNFSFRAIALRAFIPPSFLGALLIHVIYTKIWSFQSEIFSRSDVREISGYL